jgi:hypothetical protein
VRVPSAVCSSAPSVNPGAGEFWLTNRAADRWKHKQLLEFNEAADSPLRSLAKQISGTAVRPRLPEPTIIEHERKSDRRA